MTDTDQWLWIERWADFQHYKPERDRAPAWIKNYTKQLDDDAYRDLTPVQRAVLHDLRLAFTKAQGKLKVDLRRISLRVGYGIRKETLEALREAGFVTFLSREGLDLALDSVYSRARPGAREEVDEDIRDSGLDSTGVTTPKIRGGNSGTSEPTHISEDIFSHLESLKRKD